MSRSAPGRRRLGRLPTLVAVSTLVLSGAVAVVTATAATAATRPTYVSLTFDDAVADQVPAEQTLKANGFAGTFYIPDSWVGVSGYLTRSNLTQFAADGMEIGGHTVTHPDLTTVPSIEAQRQICNNRATLQSWGLRPVDFAYPFASANASVESIVQQCGYNTARGLGDVRSPASCRNCPFAETMPPADAYYLKAPDEVDGTWTLAQMKALVTNAVAHNGGWVILTFHHVCSPLGTASCPSEIATTPTIYNAFVSWLKGYVANARNMTSVRTVDQVVRQYLGASYPPYQPATSVPSTPPAPVGTNAIQNASLETRDPATGFPTCFQAGGWGTNTPAWAAVSPGHTGTSAEQLTMTNYSDGDAKLLPTLDTGTCSPTVVPGRTYDLSVWYKATGITQFALYYRDTAGAWYYWTSSPWFAPASAWTQATFTSPAVPAAAAGMSFGFALITDGTLVTDDYSLVDPGTTTTATTVAARTAVTAGALTARALTAGAVTAGAVTAAPRAAPARVAAKAAPATARVHLHERPYLPGGRGAHPGQRIAVPEPATGAQQG